MFDDVVEFDLELCADIQVEMSVWFNGFNAHIQAYRESVQDAHVNTFQYATVPF